MTHPSGYLTSRLLSGIPGLTHAFSVRALGDMRADAARRKFYRMCMDAGDICYTAGQPHGTAVAVFSGNGIPGQSDLDRVDGMVADRSQRASHGIFLGIRTADCVPILSYASAGIIGAAHAGWRGTLGNIAGKLISRMNDLGAPAGDIRVVIGPHIRRCCYHIPKDRSDAFRDAGYGDAVSHAGDGKHCLSLETVIMRQLNEEGVAAEAIERYPGCTACDRGFYSFRRDGHEKFGEQLNIIGMRAGESE
ncbi:polyphenol oxidase family protein [Patescibacteria group bacterium]|nr:polyphenol oxidase family protein [Patescibacteria group bacterium]